MAAGTPSLQMGKGLPSLAERMKVVNGFEFGRNYLVPGRKGYLTRRRLTKEFQGFTHVHLEHDSTGKLYRMTFSDEIRLASDEEIRKRFDGVLEYLKTTFGMEFNRRVSSGNCSTDYFEDGVKVVVNASKSGVSLLIENRR